MKDDLKPVTTDGCRASAPCLYQRFEPLALDDVKQLQRRPAWGFLPNFPLLNRGNAGIEIGREHGLARPGLQPQALDVRWSKRLEGAQSRGVEFPQRFHADRAEVVKPPRSFVQLFTQSLVCHVVSPPDLPRRSPASPFARPSPGILRRDSSSASGPRRRCFRAHSL